MNEETTIKCAVCNCEIRQSYVHTKDKDGNLISVWQVMRLHYMKRHPEVHDQILDWIMDATEVDPANPSFRIGGKNLE